MTAIYLVRHAEAEGNLYRRVHGVYDSLITEKGWRQIKYLEKRFEDVHIDAVYSSNLCRTQMTATAIYKSRGLPLMLTPSLREANLGVWEDKTWGEVEFEEPEQLKAFSSDPENWTTEGSEYITDLQDRIVNAVIEIARANEGKTVAAFSHGTVLRAMMAKLSDVPPSEITSVAHCDNTAVSLLRVEGVSIDVEYYGDSSHLPPELSTFYKQKWWKSKGSADNNNLRYRPFDPETDSSLYMAAREAVGSIGAEKDISHMNYTLSDGRRRIYTALSADRAVGILELDLNRYPGSGFMELYYILPEFRRSGMGVQLIGQAISVCRPLGLDRLLIDVPTELDASVEFFLEYGFAEVSRADGRVTLEKNISQEREMIMRGVR